MLRCLGVFAGLALVGLTIWMVGWWTTELPDQCREYPASCSIGLDLPFMSEIGGILGGLGLAGISGAALAGRGPWASSLRPEQVASPRVSRGDYDPLRRQALEGLRPEQEARND